ncbi:metallophosphoesterase family protein [Arthrobacter agilis]|uniref:metallophosphoesterase family protein n=1 Tax=Arthrobacter agilis TaxID=37921 RepID=UPI002365DC4B|nr:metallophosphoesterase family protein [Arthrobacter agilis]WDF33268.1 metallophosphoesterase family protein [Arthrobacter agilis]
MISDLHGNVTAFEAVLEDLRRRGIRTVYNLGDVAGKGPRGSECVRLSRLHCAVTVRGNWDDFLPTSTPEWRDDAGWWWHNELTEEDRQWLQMLPLVHDITLSGRRIRMVHASARSVYHRVHRRHSEDDFEGMFQATGLTGPGPTPDVVCYGDIHDAYVSTVRSRTLVNVGSVGNPLDEPQACYVILDGEPDGDRTEPFGIQFVRVAYDVEAEIAVAAARGMPALEAYAIELRTAIYRGLHTEPGLHDAEDGQAIGQGPAA